VTIGDPETSLRDDSVGAIVSGERHFVSVSKVCLKADVSKITLILE
jgi:hypothetical protein